MSPLELLQQVWQRSEGEFVFLPYRTEAEGWVEAEGVRPHDVTEIVSQDGDLYFTPVRYVATPRTADNQGMVGVLYADLDHDFDIEAVANMQPTLLWETSPGSYQAIWFLDRAVPAAQAIDLNKRLSHLVHADMGSWIATKVLRIPGTVNWKRGGQMGEVIAFDPDVVYPVDRLNEDLPHVPRSISKDSPAPAMPTRAEHRALLIELWPRLDHRTKQMLLFDEVPDRSLHLARLAKSMAKLNLDAPTIFGTLSRLPTNKFFHRPDVLWSSVVLTAVEQESQ